MTSAERTIALSGLARQIAAGLRSQAKRDAGIDWHADQRTEAQ